MKGWKGWKKNSWRGWGSWTERIAVVANTMVKMPLRFYNKWLKR